MANCKACGAWYSSTAPKELCHTCERALNRLGWYAVPVVRCKDCKHYVPFVDPYHKAGMCERKMLGLMAEDGFCSYGERKDKKKADRNTEIDFDYAAED